MDKNINVDDEIKDEDLVDVLGGIPYDVTVDRVINDVSANLGNKSIEELRKEKARLEALRKIALNKYVLHTLTFDDFRERKKL